MQAITLARPFGACLGARRSLHITFPRCSRPTYRFTARSTTEKKPSSEAAPSSTQDDVPLWVKREEQRRLQKEAGGSKDLPWPLYLVMSMLTSIAAIGSVFEYLNHNPVFGVLPPDNPAWAPILGFFAITGLPSAGFFFFKGVSGANAAAEMQDKLDGYMD